MRTHLQIVVTQLPGRSTVHVEVLDDDTTLVLVDPEVGASVASLLEYHLTAMQRLAVLRALREHTSRDLSAEYLEDRASYVEVVA